jgi:hypothetical protein
MSSSNIRPCKADDAGHHAICGCGHQPPIHCMWCCEDLTREEIKACLDRGNMIAAEVLEKQGLSKLVNDIRKPADK